MGRGKLQLKRIENATNRQITFSKRRNGLLKKACELAILCDVEVGLLIFSPSGKSYHYSSHDIENVISRYRETTGTPILNCSLSRQAEYWRTEMGELKKALESLEMRQKHLAGHDLLSLGIREVKQLERQMKVGLDRIRSRKNTIITEHINQLKKKQKELEEENAHLRQRLRETDMVHAVVIGEDEQTLRQPTAAKVGGHSQYFD